ncbi:MAG TPA: GyrI-like domain-containing protein [Beijerinckiaceae bacterium]|jgi:effector-binding domain-containing protein
MILIPWIRFAALVVALGAGSLALAQTAPPAGVPRPGAVESAPLAPPGGAAEAPAPSAPPTAPPPSSAGAPVGGAVGRPTLVPGPGDSTDVAEVTLPAKPAVVIAGTSTSDEGFATLRRAFRQLEDELARAGIPPAGRPLAVFQNFNPDGSFNYEAMVPIERAPEGRTLLSNEIRFGMTPTGRALRFTHKGAYEEVESTYDMIEVYLEAKGIVVNDPIIEEFVNDPKDAADADLELNIFVQPK